MAPRLQMDALYAGIMDTKKPFEKLRKAFKMGTLIF